jgi:phage N-6-adenine-methyltransferase
MCMLHTVCHRRPDVLWCPMHGSLTTTQANSGRTITSVQKFVRAPGQILPMDQLLRDGQASCRRIRAHEKGVKQARKAILTEWLDQAERLWVAGELHGLKGKRFRVFAEQIGVDRSSAYELLKLHERRKEIIAECRAAGHWPGWETFIKRNGDDAVESDATSNARLGIQSPTWQKFKTTDDEYGSPQALFDHYNRRFKFTLDVASSAKLAKCRKFFSKEQDGLTQDWGNHFCWLNPPYSQLGKWVRKAYEAAKAGATVVALLPIYTDAAWFHDFASHATIEVLRGRLQFENRDQNGYTPFGHGIFIFRKRSARRRNRLTISLDGHRIGTSLGK